MTTATGTVVVYFVLVFVAFLVGVLITRAIFRINKIVNLLASIDTRLQLLGSSLKAVSTQAVDHRQPAPPGKNPSTLDPLGIAASDLAVGEKLEKQDGQIVEVVEFVQGGLKVKDASGSTEILAPRFQKTQWVYDVRRPS